jgi:hypothetical protein
MGSTNDKVAGGLQVQHRLNMIRPERRAVVKGRIEALERYLAIERPTTADADAMAREFGMTRISFYRLLRTWRARRDPADLAGPGAKTGRRGTQQLPGDDFIARTLPTLPADISPERQVRALEDAARQAGVVLPARGTLRRRVADFRGGREPDPIGIGDALAVGHVVLEIPIVGPPGLTLPLATVVARPGRGIVLATSLSLAVPGPRAVAAVLLSACARGTTLSDGPASRPDSTVFVDADQLVEWDPLFSVLAEHGLRRSGRDGPRVLGDRLLGSVGFPSLLGFRSRPRMIYRPAGLRRPRVRGPLNAPVSLAEAQAVLDARLASHAAVTSAPPMFCDAGLADALRAFLSSTPN